MANVFVVFLFLTYPFKTSTVNRELCTLCNRIYRNISRVYLFLDVFAVSHSPKFERDCKSFVSKDPEFIC